MPFRSLRELVHCEGPLPTETKLEVVFAPTFHPPVGLRLRDHGFELWTRTDVREVLAELPAELFPRALALTHVPTDLDGQGRDGMAVLVRTHTFDLVRLTVTAPPDDEVLRFAWWLIDALPGEHHEFAPLRRYLRSGTTLGGRP